MSDNAQCEKCVVKKIYFELGVKSGKTEIIRKFIDLLELDERYEWRQEDE